MELPERPAKAVGTATDALIQDEFDDDDKALTFTVDQGIEALGMGRFQYIILALAGLCWISDSMEMLLLAFIKSPFQCEFNLTDVQAALVTTSVGAGMLIGNLAWGFLADSRGRRTAFIAAVAFTLIFGILSALAPSYAFLVVARGLTGLGIGGVPIAFALIMEFLPTRSRGRWGMGLALFWSLGAVFEAVLAMLVMPHLGWRWLIALSSLPLALLILLSPFLPESPRWLAARGRLDAATAVLRRASLANSRPLPPGILIASSDDIPPPPPAASPLPKKRLFPHFTALVRPGIRSISFKLWIVWFCAAFTYYGAVVLQPDMLASEKLGRRCSYTKDMCMSHIAAPTCDAQNLCAWNATGLSCQPGGIIKARKLASVPNAFATANPACSALLTRADYVSALWSTSGEIPGTLITLFAVDWIGRRGLLVYLYALGAAAFALLVTCPGRTMETALFFVARGVSNGYFQAIYLYTNEIYPAKVRASAMGMSSAVARVGLIVTPLVGQFLDNVNFALAIAIYSGACVVAVLAVLFIPIETTRRPLLGTIEELMALLQGKDVGDDEYASFSRDPTVHPFVRLFRLPARIDGRGARIVS